MCNSTSAKAVDEAELKEAADRLAAELSEVEEDEIVAEFKQLRQAGKTTAWVPHS